MAVHIFAATEAEVAPLRELLKNAPLPANRHQIHITVTGPGILSSSFHITQTLLAQRPDYMIQTGIAGSYTATLPIDTVVLVREEYVGDCGVMESGQFRDLFDLRFNQENTFPFHHKGLLNPHLHQVKGTPWPEVTGITVNEISTEPEQIERLRVQYDAGTESMEGAAFHYAGLMLRIPFFQVRGISNRVGIRDKSQWSIGPAIHNACQAVYSLLSTLPL